MGQVRAEIMKEARYIDNWKIIMSAVVSAGMDASLHVVRKLIEVERALQAAQIMEYNWKVSKSYAQEEMK